MAPQSQDDVKARFEKLCRQTRSLILATTDEHARPRASYAPFVRDDAGRFYVYVSRLSAHTMELFTNPVASVMLIEDEAEADQMFARTRITYLCDVTTVDSTDPSYNTMLDLMAEGFGNVVDVLRVLPDFVLFQLQPRSGRFVAGFGQSYDLGGDRLDQLHHVGPEQLKSG